MANKLKAADIMNPHVVVAHPDMTILEASKLMNKFRIGGLPVVKGDKLVGIMTERCIMKHVIGQDKRSGKVKVRDIMVPGNQLITAAPGDSVESVAKKIKEYDKTRIPVVDKGKLIGIITNKDVLENAPTLCEMVLDQAKMNSVYDQLMSSVSFGKCEDCGVASDLFFREQKFVCGKCAGLDKRPLHGPGFFGMFRRM